MIIVTGGAGFIGSAFVWKLNEEGIEDILIVDDPMNAGASRNLDKRKFSEYIQKDTFLKGILGKDIPSDDLTAIVHMGACSSTTEKNVEYMMSNNFEYTKHLAEWALENEVRFVYASSAATYGDGTKGYSDADEVTPTMKPLNVYGESKQRFDCWALDTGSSEQIAGIKYFNVYGPNEYHKGDMRSVVNKAFHQVEKTEKIRLFKSYKSEYSDGGQMRDFIYVKDCCDVMFWLMQNPGTNGIFNLGTGRARTWNDLAVAVFEARGKPVNIEYIDMPEGLNEQYQYYTCAEMEKLRTAGWIKEFATLEDGVKDYVQNYLSTGDPYL